jgi:two-component system, OmpR family, KDP operon response regulator KdpE
VNKTRILVVDDELSIIKFLRANLVDKRYEVLVAMNGVEALETFEKELPDLMILDIMMPKIDGFEVCRRLREWSQVPIIMLSARGDEDDKVKCLDLGADDYITKPFGKDELVARVKAVMRRTESAAAVPTQPSCSSGDIDINFVRRQVTVAGKEVKLTPTEYNLLQEFVLNAGKVLTHTHLLNKVWGPEYREETQYLHVFVRRLRAKLEPDPTNPRYIVTVSGVGYQFKDTA